MIQYVADRQVIIKLARDGMHSAHQRMRAYKKSKRKELLFNAGDQVSLKITHRSGYSTVPSKMLFWKNLGPFTVSWRINNAAYELELPKTMS